MAEEAPLVFEHGKIAFDLHKEQYEEDMEPPLGSSEEVIGLHAASTVTDYPSGVNQMLACIMRGEWNAATSSIKKPEDFRGHMTAMLTLDYLAPWIKEETIKSVFRTACDATIELLYTSAISDFTEESLVVDGKRKRVTVDYGESKRARFTEGSDDEESDEEESDDDEESDEESDDSSYSDSGHGSDHNESEEEDNESRSSVSESELDVAEEKDPYLYTHEHMRAFALTGAVDTGKWKVVFAEWWNRVFERRLMDDPDLAVKIWPAFDDYCERWGGGGRRNSDPNNLNREIAKVCASELKRIQAGTEAKVPLKATRRAHSVNIYADFTKDEKLGFAHYNFHLGFTQPLPFYKRTKVKTEDNQHKFAQARRVKANPILYTVTGGDLLKVVVARMKTQFDVTISPEQVFFTGGKGSGWLVDFEDMKMKDCFDIIILSDPELRALTKIKLENCYRDMACIKDVCKPWMDDGKTENSVGVERRILDIEDFRKGIERFDGIILSPLQGCHTHSPKLHPFYYNHLKQMIVESVPGVFAKSPESGTPSHALRSLCLLGYAIKWVESDDYVQYTGSRASRIKDICWGTRGEAVADKFQLLKKLRMVTTEMIRSAFKPSDGVHLPLSDELKAGFDKVQYFHGCWTKKKNGTYMVPRHSERLKKSLEKAEDAIESVIAKYDKK